MNHFVITIARGFGSGGKSIGIEIAKQLGINCYENRILTLASQLSGLDEKYFVRADEKLDTNYLLAKLKEIPITLRPKPVTNNFTSNKALFNYQAQIIRQLAENESCIIVGKCADYILKDHKNVFSFYIEAPRDYCLKRITTRMNISEKEAHALISKTDKYRADYYKYYTNGNYWTNPVNYDLTLNSKRVGHNCCIETIIDYIKRKTFAA